LKMLLQPRHLLVNNSFHLCVIHWCTSRAWLLLRLCGSWNFRLLLTWLRLRLSGDYVLFLTITESFHFIFQDIHVLSDLASQSGLIDFNLTLKAYVLVSLGLGRVVLDTFDVFLYRFQGQLDVVDLLAVC
jgi:hypothetical protein